MCGRFAQSISVESALAVALELDLQLRWNYQARLFSNWNLAPSEQVLIYRANGPSLTAAPVHFGFTFGNGRSTLNARAETLSERSSFARSLRLSRCLIEMTGFYEWERSAQSRLPHFFSRYDRSPLWAAGLLDAHEDGVAIVTTESTPPISAIHSRSPLFIEAYELTAWLLKGAFPTTRPILEDQHLDISYNRASQKTPPPGYEGLLDEASEMRDRTAEAIPSPSRPKSVKI
ncbi:MAG: SOS response-associated peptidase [Ferrimicrobium sp.]